MSLDWLKVDVKFDVAAVINAITVLLLALR